MTYYVAPNGNDDNPGTARRPFKTIQQAADLVNPGDSVIVEDGVYSGTGEGTPCASRTSRPVVCLTRGGTSRAWVTIAARNPGGAKLDGGSNTSTDGFRFLADANYIRVEGFEIYGMGSPTQSATGFELYVGGHDTVIASNHIHDIGRLCTDTTTGESAIFVEQPRVVIARNVIHDIGRFSPGEQGCAPRTDYYGNHDHGIYLDGNSPGASDALVVNNLFYNMRHGWPIQLYPGSLNGVSILNNTFVGENPYSYGQIVIGASTTGSRIINNVFADPLGGAICFYAGAHTNLVVSNNVSSRRLGDKRPDGVSFGNNVENTAPGLTREFTPAASSPAIAHGVPLPEVLVDLAGSPRPRSGSPDIGAYQYQPPTGASKKR